MIYSRFRSGDPPQHAPTCPMPSRKRHYWLLKSEPDTFSLEDLQKVRRENWDGVRNYQARNFLRDMKVGDLALFYHSRVSPPVVVGLAAVSRKAQPDETALDPQSPYYDPKHTAEEPRWFAPEVEYLQHLPEPVTLEQLKAEPALAEMKVVQRGQRLSVQPVTAAEFRKVCRLGGLAKLP